MSRQHFSAERVANDQVRQLADESRAREVRPVSVGEWAGDWAVEEIAQVSPAERIRLLYGLPFGGAR